jgi:hypothetical protein
MGGEEMAILFNRTLIFNDLDELLLGRNTFQLVLQNGISQSLCDLHIQTQNSLGIPPMLASLKIQTTFEAKQLVLTPPVISLDLDLTTFFNTHQCIPVGGTFLLTLTFTRTFLPEDTLLIGPTNSQGIIVIG